MGRLEIYEEIYFIMRSFVLPSLLVSQGIIPRATSQGVNEDAVVRRTQCRCLI